MGMLCTRRNRNGILRIETKLKQKENANFCLDTILEILPSKIYIFERHFDFNANASAINFENKA